MEYPEAARRDSWSRYWATGAIHSCADSFDGKLGIATQTYWNRVFRLLGSGDRVLELGSGNGALARFLCDRYLLGAPIEYEAVDLAELKPEWLERIPPAVRARVRFHPGTRIEELPFENASMSYVVGQYAIEYADWDRAWDEVFRVCRRIARIGLLMHHRDALPISRSVEEAEHCAWLLGEDSPYAIADDLIPYLAMASTELGRKRLASDEQAASLREHYNRRQAALQARAKGSQTPDLLIHAAEGLNEAFARAQQYGRDAGRELLETQRMHLRDARLRVEEARDCALDGAAMTALIRRLHEQGFEDVEYVPLHENNELFAWALYAHRS